MIRSGFRTGAQIHSKNLLKELFFFYDEVERASGTFWIHAICIRGGWTRVIAEWNFSRALSFHDEGDFFFFFFFLFRRVVTVRFFHFFLKRAKGKFKNWRGINFGKRLVFFFSLKSSSNFFLSRNNFLGVKPVFRCRSINHC